MKGPAIFKGEIITKKQKYIDEIYKKFLLQNHLANFNQTWHIASLDEGDSKFIQMKGHTFSEGR